LEEILTPMLEPLMILEKIEVWLDPLSKIETSFGRKVLVWESPKKLLKTDVPTLSIKCEALLQTSLHRRRYLELVSSNATEELAKLFDLTVVEYTRPPEKVTPPV